MTEAVMYFGIGFFVAALIGLLIVPHARSRVARLGSVDQFQADVRQLEEQLDIALGERSKLQHEIAAMKRDAELTWAAGEPANAIVDTAKRIRAQVIVLGEHHHGFLGNLFGAVVDAAVQREAGCDVILA